MSNTCTRSFRQLSIYICTNICIKIYAYYTQNWLFIFTVYFHIKIRFEILRTVFQAKNYTTNDSRDAEKVILVLMCT